MRIRGILAGPQLGGASIKTVKATPAREIHMLEAKPVRTRHLEPLGSLILRSMHSGVMINRKSDVTSSTRVVSNLALPGGTRYPYR